MNRDVDPESVVARRELTVDGRAVTLLVGAARPFADDEPDVFCPFRLEEADGTEIWSAVAGGVDTAQAVLLALTGAGERLASHDGEVTFLGSRELRAAPDLDIGRGLDRLVQPRRGRSRRGVR